MTSDKLITVSELKEMLDAVGYFVTTRCLRYRIEQGKLRSIQKVHNGTRYIQESEALRYVEQHRGKKSREKADVKKYDQKIWDDESKAKLRERKYGITQVEYNTMLASQKNLCAICKRVLYGGRKTHIDHCHNTGVVRGILCNKCNAGIGMLQDDVQILHNAISYLERYQCQAIGKA